MRTVLSATMSLLLASSSPVHSEGDRAQQLAASGLQRILATYEETGRTPSPRTIVSLLARLDQPPDVDFSKLQELLQASHLQVAAERWGLLMQLPNAAEKNGQGVVRLSARQVRQARQWREELLEALEKAGVVPSEYIDLTRLATAIGPWFDS